VDRELESLLGAYDAWLEAGEEDAERQRAVFEDLLDGVVAGRPSLTREQFLKALRAYHPRWIRAQEHPPTLPPKA